MKLFAHIVTAIFLIYSLKVIASETLVESLTDGPVEVLIDQKNGSISVNNHEIDNRFLIKSKKVKKGGDINLDLLTIMVIGDKLIIDYKQVDTLVFSSGNQLYVRQLVEHILSGSAAIGDPTGTHGGGK